MQNGSTKVNAKTLKFVPTVLCSILAIILQFIIFETSPQIQKENLLPQFYIALKGILVEFIILGLLLLLINIFFLRLNKRENLKCLSILFGIDILVFIVWFGIYANK